MDIKKILIVSRSFYPVNSPRSFRTTELVKEFAKQGHDVTLLTLKKDEHHLPFEHEYGVTIKDFGPLRFPEIGWAGGNRVSQLIGKVVKRGVQHFFEYPDIELKFRVKKAVQQESAYDLLISIAVPHSVHWGVAAARSKKKPIAKTWAADCGDPYMGFTNGRVKKPFYFKYFEKAFCRKADFITVPLEGAKKAYYPEFRDKFRVIPQGFNFDENRAAPEDYRRNDVPTFGYAGDLLGGGRDPDLFLDYIVSLEKPFKFIIYTKQNHVVKHWIQNSKGRIELRGTIPRDELLPELGKMDFLVNFENNTTVQMPSKLIDYHLAGRPVLSVGSTSIDRNAVDNFLDGIYTERYKYNNFEQYKIENVCRKFLELCNNH